MPTLSIENISAGYGARNALDGLTLPPIEAGRITALIGPNGAGKTTLLRMLAGLVPASGEVRLGERDLLAMPAAERARLMAFMPQFVPQRLSLTVLETVVTALRASPISLVSAEDVRRHALETLQRLEILDLALEPFDRLSGGQRQLASLAQALARQPQLLLLDEPTSALDLRHQVQVIRNVREAAASGTTVIVVLHDLQAVAAWADTAIVLTQGRLYGHGAPRSVITSAMLREVYGIAASVEETTRGGLHISMI